MDIGLKLGLCWVIFFLHVAAVSSADKHGFPKMPTVGHIP